MRHVRRIGGIAGLVFATSLAIGTLNFGPRALAAGASSADLSTRAGIDTYLSSHGFAPSSAVHQTGRLNYAGPHCPGKGWTCTSSKGAVVVQQAQVDGVNVFQCTASTGGSSNPSTDTCVVVQTAQSNGSTNSATCTEQASGTAPAPTCSITQDNTGGANKAGVTQEWSQQTGDAQTAAETASITQTNTTGLNRGQIRQIIGQRAVDSATNQDEEATQFACIQQDSPSGQNQATVYQQVTQNEQSTASTGLNQLQNQNAGTDQTCGNRTTAITPNQAAQVQQDQGSSGDTGQNQSTVTQTLHQKQLSTAASGTVTQQQGNNGDSGGLEADLNQTSTAVATATASQNENQLEDAETTGLLSQLQNDPHRCCSNQASNPSDQLTFNSVTVQNADSGASQFHDDEGFCTSSGTCHVNIQVTDNTGTTSDSCTPGPCAVIEDNEGG